MIRFNKPFFAKQMKIARCMIVLAVLAMTGCAEKQILDETGLSTITGYDLTKDRYIRSTTLIPVINPEAGEKIQVASAVGLTSKGVRDQINLQVDKRVMSGQLRVVLYNEKLAKKGIISIVDTMYRDPSIASRLYLCVTKDETYKIITYPFKEEGNLGMFVYRMIDQNVNGERIPSPTIHEFLRAYYSEGSDPYLPYIEQKGDELYIRGLALFNKDRYIGWVDTKDAFLIKLIKDMFKAGSYEATIPRSAVGLPAKKNEEVGGNTVNIVFDTIRSQSKVEVTQQHPPRFNVTIDLKTRVYEVSEQISLEEKEALAKVQTALEKEIEKRAQQMVKKLQKMDVDPIGFGDYYRASSLDGSKLTHKEWHKIYKEATFQFHVKADLIRSGIMD